MSQRQQPAFPPRSISNTTIVPWLIAISLSLSIGTALVACQKVGASNGQKLSREGRQEAPKARETGQFSKGMAYADLRALAIKGGWIPVVDAQCKSNVMGSNYQQLCSSEAHSALCTACDISPELSGCSGDGYCGMYFSKDGLMLHVVTYGMIEDLKVSGESSRLNVDGWDISRRP